MSWDMVMARAASLSDQELGLRYKWERTVFVTNLAYECKWPMLKDFMKENVGEVMFCDVFEENGRSSGTAAVEFKTLEDARNACRMNLKLFGRKLSIFMDEGGRRTRRAAQQSVVARVMAGKREEGGFKPAQPPMKDGGAGQQNLVEALTAAVSHNTPGHHNVVGGGRRSPPIMRERAMSFTARGTEEVVPPMLDRSQGRLYTLLRRLGVGGDQLSDRVIVSNLDSRVTRQKLFDVFSLAGQVLDATFLSTPPGVCPSAAIQFDRVVDALQAIAMLDGQYLYERRMLVRLSGSSLRAPSPMKLPAGLGGIGDRLDIEDLLVCQNSAANMEGKSMGQRMSSCVPSLEEQRINDMSRRKRAAEESGTRMLSPVLTHRGAGAVNDNEPPVYNNYVRREDPIRHHQQQDIYEDLRRRLKEPRMMVQQHGMQGSGGRDQVMGESGRRNGGHPYRGGEEPLRSAQHYSERLRNSLYPVERPTGGHQFFR